MEGVSRFCPQCRGYIRSEHLDEARSFRGELYHRQCILKHVLDAIGLAFNHDIEVLGLIRTVKNVCSRFEQVLLIVWRRHAVYLSEDDAELRELLRDVLVEGFAYTVDELIIDSDEENVIRISAGAVEAS
ncbi:hypothetical protein HN858_04085 [Candidatus Falkowbacteria bacterium]|jgi:hypothetical protein|nr:hypothetical protein [Candidatus Falkowbacteria bacterium]MBT5503170.1 hypothetical protein [Candidatus Falkowbacteria bacterium]MBT6574558.1 hypothetical protein [Candidatus Falkowbacteria bacterium]MBT7348827.1 hypothetical protein [Candidatus Falkowbacteria bacterium]MBT7500865.1 hypothetical protein [Candidatus Falkowbacteria bacterium]